MLLASIKKLAKQRKKKTSPTGTPSKSVYGGIGLNNCAITPPETITGDVSSGDAGGSDGGGE